MMEAEWFRYDEPLPMIEHLKDSKRNKPSERKLRLFGCACCRRAWNLLKDELWRKAVETAEQYADGLAKATELKRFRLALENVPYSRTSVRKSDNALFAAMTVVEASWNRFYKPWMAMTSVAGQIASAIPGRQYRKECRQQCLLVRDIFGNPFRDVTVDPSCQTGNVVALAHAVYTDRAFDRMPILADALEDAGCTNADILNHCRQPGNHVRGCWVVDLVLGKQ